MEKTNIMLEIYAELPLFATIFCLLSTLPLVLREFSGAKVCAAFYHGFFVSDLVYALKKGAGLLKQALNALVLSIATSTAETGAIARPSQKATAKRPRLAFLHTVAIFGLFLPAAFSFRSNEHLWRYLNQSVKRDESGRCTAVSSYGSISEYAYQNNGSYTATCKNEKNEMLWSGNKNPSGNIYTKDSHAKQYTTVASFLKNGCFMECITNTRTNKSRVIERDEKRRIKTGYFRNTPGQFNYTYEQDGSYTKTHTAELAQQIATAYFDPQGVCRKIFLHRVKITLRIGYNEDRTFQLIVLDENEQAIACAEVYANMKIRRFICPNARTITYDYKEDGTMTATYEKVVGDVKQAVHSITYNNKGVQTFMKIFGKFSIEYVYKDDGKHEEIYSDQNGIQQYIYRYNKFRELISSFCARTELEIIYILKPDGTYRGHFSPESGELEFTTEHDLKGRVLLKNYTKYPSGERRDEFVYANTGECLETCNLVQDGVIDVVNNYYNSDGQVVKTELNNFIITYEYNEFGEAVGTYKNLLGKDIKQKFYNIFGRHVKTTVKGKKAVTYDIETDGTILETHWKQDGKTALKRYLYKPKRAIKFGCFEKYTMTILDSR